MTQGIWIRGYPEGGIRRPKSKKEIREAVAANPENVFAEATSFHGGEFDGPVSSLPINGKVVFAGPDPYTRRNFYGTITRKANGEVKVT